MTQRELIEKHRRGERITKADSKYSCFEAVDLERQRAHCIGRGHSWRPIVCGRDADGDERDVCECGGCGEQREMSCNFDEDCS